ncbi:MAG: regulator of protease activity HflC (stomatin/prohibitin superfamily) [Candidatus Paceibacteria bacterium]|jgi:regulator of protease activity HflC (stomatin/prohibitin superfamily)
MKKENKEYKNKYMPDEETQEKNIARTMQHQWIGSSIVTAIVCLIAIMFPGTYTPLLAWLAYVLFSVIAQDENGFRLSSVKMDEQAVVTTAFGRPLYVLPEGYGLVFEFPGFYKVHLVTKKLQQKQFPGEPEEVRSGIVEQMDFNTNSSKVEYYDLSNLVCRKKILKLAKKEPELKFINPIELTVDGDGNSVSITDSGMTDVAFAKKFKKQITEYEKKEKFKYEGGLKEKVEGEAREIVEGDPLHRRLKLKNISFFVIWRISRPFFYTKNYDSIYEVNKNLRDTSESVLIKEFAKRTPAMLLSQIDEINWKLQANLKFEIENLDDPESHWGIEISDAMLVKQNLESSVADDLDELAKAQISILAERARGIAESVRAEEAVKGKAAAVERMGKAEGMAIKSKRVESGLSPEMVLEMDTRVEVAKAVGNVTLISSGDKPDLLGTIVAATSVAKETNNSKQKKEEENG